MADLLTEVQSDDRRRALVAVRDALAAAMQAADPAVQAQLAGQLRAVLKDISDLPTVAAGSPLEAAKQQRAARRGGLKAV